MTFPRFSILRSVDLPCPVEELYDFHQNPANMRTILPPGQKLERFEGDPIAHEGDELILHLRVVWVLRIRWKARWATADPPSRLVDDCLEGPFPLFLHEHRFRPLPDGSSRLTDHIMYALPLPWLTWPLSLTVGYWALSQMLKIRHARTLAHFSK